MGELELAEGAGAQHGDVPQAPVAGHDVWGDLLLARCLEAVGAQGFEEVPRPLVEISLAGPGSTARLPGPAARGSRGRDLSRRRQQHARRAPGVDDRAPFLGHHHHWPVSALEIDPAGGDAAAQQLQQPVLRILSQGAEGRGAVEARRLQAIVGLPLEQPGGRLDAEAAVYPRHAAQCLAHYGAHLFRVLLRFGQHQADVAAATAGQGLLLISEVAQDGVVAAAPTLCPSHQLEEEIPLVANHFRIGSSPIGVALDQVAAQRHVTWRDQQQTDGIFPVATGATGFLVVGLDRAGRRQMSDATHVGPVYPHAESVSGHDHLHLASGKSVLHPVARHSLHAGVVGAANPAVYGQALRLLFGAFAGRGVDDRRAASVAGNSQVLAQQAVDVATALAFGLDLDDSQRQIGSRETVDELRRIRRQSQARQNLVPHNRRSCSGAGQHARLRELLQHGADLHIVGPEIVAPLADTVGLVDGDERAVQPRQHRPQGAVGQTLGGDVDELVLPSRHGRHAASQLIGLHRSRQIGGADTAILEGGDLVMHERDQRRHHQRSAGQQGSGKLVDQALAATRGRHQQHSPHAQKGLNRLPLTGPESGEAQLIESTVQVYVSHASWRVMQYIASWPLPTPEESRRDRPLRMGAGFSFPR